MSPGKTRRDGLRLWLAVLLFGCSSGSTGSDRGSSGAGASAGGASGSSGANAGGSGGGTVDGGGASSCTFQGTYQLELQDAELSKINTEECSVIACAGNLCGEFLCTPGNPVTRCTSGDLVLLLDGPTPPECVLIRDQIESLLLAKVEEGVLLGNAVPCGPDGIGAHPEYFMAGTSADIVASLTGDFAARCQSFVDCVTRPAATP